MLGTQTCNPYWKSHKTNHVKLSCTERSRVEKHLLCVPVDSFSMEQVCPVCVLVNPCSDCLTNILTTISILVMVISFQYFSGILAACSLYLLPWLAWMLMLPWPMHVTACPNTSSIRVAISWLVVDIIHRTLLVSSRFSHGILQPQ